MRKKVISLYWILSIFSVFSFVVLIGLFVCLYINKNDAILLGIFSVWISVVSGLLFSSVVSLLVQFINDNANKKDLLERKEAIRKREINFLSKSMSPFLSYYHYIEESLLEKYKLQNSMINNNLNANIIHLNMQKLNQISKKANKRNKELIDNYLLLSNSIQEQYNKVIDLLYKKVNEFNNINLDFNSEIFKQEEIETLKIVPLYGKHYSDNIYQYIENFSKIVDVFKLKIDFDNHIWESLLAIAIISKTL